MKEATLSIQPANKSIPLDSQKAFSILEQAIGNAEGKSDTERFSNVLSLLNTPDVADLLAYLQSYVILGLVYVFSCLTGAAPKPQEIVVWIAVLLYVFLPDLIPGSADDILALAAAMILFNFADTIRDFAARVMVHDPLFVRIGGKEIKIPQDTLEIIRQHAKRVLNPPEPTLTNIMVIEEVVRALLNKAKALPKQ